MALINKYYKLNGAEIQYHPSNTPKVRKDVNVLYHTLTDGSQARTLAPQKTTAGKIPISYTMIDQTTMQTFKALRDSQATFTWEDLQGNIYYCKMDEFEETVLSGFSDLRFDIDMVFGVIQ